MKHEWVGAAGLFLFGLAVTVAWIRFMIVWPWQAVAAVAVLGLVLMCVAGGMERWERRQVRKINRQLAGARWQ